MRTHDQIDEEGVGWGGRRRVSHPYRRGSGTADSCQPLNEQWSTSEDYEIGRHQLIESAF